MLTTTVDYAEYPKHPEFYAIDTVTFLVHVIIYIVHFFSQNFGV